MYFGVVRDEDFRSDVVIRKEDHQGSRVELRIGFDLDIEENLNTAWEILN